MTCVVTGASGFIGKATSEELIRRGWRVVGLDVASSPEECILKYDFEELFKDKNIKAVIHLAGIHGGALFTEAEEAVQVNTVGATRILKAINVENVRRTRDGEAPIKYVTTTSLPGWNTVFQISMQAAEKLALAWDEHRQVKSTIVRVYTCYGPNQKLGEGPRAAIVPTFSVNGWSNDPIQVWDDGSAVVDLVHVYDVARILVDSISLPGGEIIDAGTGTATSVSELAERIARHTDSVVHYIPMRKAGFNRNDPPVAKGEGWEHLQGGPPKFSWDDLYDVVDWYKS